MPGAQSAPSSGDSSVWGVHYAVARLESIVGLGALRQKPDEYERLSAVRRADLVTCLASSRNEQVTYDLRLISRPDPSNISQGVVEVYLSPGVYDFLAQKAGWKNGVKNNHRISKEKGSTVSIELEQN